MIVRGGLKGILSALFVLLLVFFSQVAMAGTPALTFTNGWVGQYSGNAHGADTFYAFDGGSPDLNIKSVTISQNSSTNQFVSQGNDVPVTITVDFINGSRQSVEGAANWRNTQGSTLRAIGLRLDQTINDGYPLGAGMFKTYLLKVAGSTLTIANGGSPGGNAASVLDSLNALLGTTPNFTVSKSAPASVVEAGALSYTIGIGNSGGGISGTSVTVQDAMPAGASFVSATVGTGVSSVNCSQSGQIVTCTATLSSGIAAFADVGAARFTINTTAPTSGSSITNYVSIDPNGGANPSSASECTTVVCARATTTITGTASISGVYLRSNGNTVNGATIQLLSSADAILATATTNSAGAYQFNNIRSGTYGIRFPSNGAVKGKAKSNSGSPSGEYIRNISLTTSAAVSDADAIIVDPAGVIYDSVSRQAVSNAIVRLLFNGSLVNNSWLDQVLGGPNTQTTLADGNYSFVLNGTAQTGTYTIDVTAPSGYTFESTAIAPTAGPYDPGLGGGVVLIQPQSTAPTGADSTTYYLAFSLQIGTTSATTSNGVIHNHIPIDPVPVVSIANTANASEPATNGVVTVSLSTASATNTVIAYDVAGSAAAGTDYTALSGTVTVTAGQTSATINVPVIDDSLVEGAETVIVTLTSVTSGTASLSGTASALTATNTIGDNDAPVVSIANTANASEPATNGVVTVSLSTASVTNTVIAYDVAGSAAAGTDYTALSGTVTVTAGQTSATISVPVIDDSLVEGAETVIVTLTSVTSGTASLSGTASALTATNTIGDDDVATVSIANTANASEPATNGVITVSLSTASATDTVIAYSVAGSAAAGTDYTALSGTVTVTAGQTEVVPPVWTVWRRS